MKRSLLLFGLLLSACSSSSSAPAPQISNFTLTSPLPAGSTTVTGSLSATDTAGLTDLTLKITITGDGVSSSLTAPVEGGAATETAATIPVEIELTTAIPAGTYQVEVTLMESGESSNALSTSVVVQ
jgi:hypothetical protein